MYKYSAALDAHTRKCAAAAMEKIKQYSGSEICTRQKFITISFRAHFRNSHRILTLWRKHVVKQVCCIAVIKTGCFDLNMIVNLISAQGKLDLQQHPFKKIQRPVIKRFSRMV
jgi:hypothetical protein